MLQRERVAVAGHQPEADEKLKPKACRSEQRLSWMECLVGMDQLDVESVDFDGKLEPLESRAC